ncbi:response regulator [Marinicella meishanensis]|uniref:response regulator n=1 Tax=Marinicella meishanensis TaxID=2873263 RepID=UPI001CC11192|nr:response regulator [Marinicella sp. NBU2979]
MKHARILVVEDQEDLAALLSDYLQQEAWQVDLIHHGDEVEAFIQQHMVDVVLLDVMLPGKNGMDICRDIRKTSDVPIIMTTARVDEIDRILGLEIGANDYVCKPYSPRELVARVKVWLRHKAKPCVPPVLELDTESMVVSCAGSQVELTLVECRLLDKMMSQPSRVFSRSQLMDAVYDDGRIVSDRTIDSHIKKLRARLKRVQPQQDLIHAIYGCGYKYEEDR